jgi:hypothetical protein
MAHLSWLVARMGFLADGGSDIGDWARAHPGVVSLVALVVFGIVRSQKGKSNQ